MVIGACLSIFMSNTHVPCLLIFRASYNEAVNYIRLEIGFLIKHMKNISLINLFIFSLFVVSRCLWILCNFCPGSEEPQVGVQCLARWEKMPFHSLADHQEWTGGCWDGTANRRCVSPLWMLVLSEGSSPFYTRAVDGLASRSLATKWWMRTSS